MTKITALAGVAHNIAHHSASGLSYISPHLANALRQTGQETTEIDLLAPEPYPIRAIESMPLRLALGSLRATAQETLQKHGFKHDDVTSIVLHATPAPWDKDGYVLHTRIVITAKNGRTFDSGWL